MKSRTKTPSKSKKRQPRMKKPPKGSLAERLLKMVDEITADIPPEVWEKLPRDLSKNLDHYLYGLPKREPE